MRGWSERKMPNPFFALDSDDEGEAVQAKPVKKTAEVGTQVPPSKPANADSKTAAKPRAVLKKEEEDLKQPKKSAAGSRGGQHGGPAGVTHPGERSKTGAASAPRQHTNPKKEESREPAPGEKLHRRGHDRHTPGTGRHDSTKKDGAGNHNWGKALPDVKGVPTSEAVAAVTEGDESKNAEEKAGEGNAEEPTDAAPEPVKDTNLTLQEFEALRAAKRAGEAFAERPVAKPTNTVDGEVYFRAHDDEPKGETKATKETKQSKKLVEGLNYSIKSSDAGSAPRSEFRGGRGGGRPSGGDRPPRADGDRPPRGSPRGGQGGFRSGPPRGDRPAQQAAPRGVDPNDASAFPKLGA